MRLSRETGIAQSTLSNYECGTKIPMSEHLKLIAKTLGVSVKDISNPQNYLSRLKGMDDVDREIMYELTTLDRAKKKDILEYVRGMADAV